MIKNKKGIYRLSVGIDRALLLYGNGLYIFKLLLIFGDRLDFITSESITKDDAQLNKYSVEVMRITK